jgi:hypothetical protein
MLKKHPYFQIFWRTSEFNVSSPEAHFPGSDEMPNVVNAVDIYEADVENFFHCADAPFTLADQ